MSDVMSEYNQAIGGYRTKWEGLLAGLRQKPFFDSLQPNAIGWKVTNIAEFDTRLAGLRPLADQIHLGWVNNRWIATLHLKDTPLDWGIEVIKIMQRRPGSTDAVGLDHVDFYTPDVSQARQVAAAEPGLQSTLETSNPYCDWVSLWFTGTEAKLRGISVIEVCIAELQRIQPGASSE